MREIKFRGWDKKDKIMWEPMTLSDLILGGWEMENADGSWSLPHDDYIQFSHDETIWMQYTGLKDAKSVEIYEGDIIKKYEGYRGVVEFYEGEYCVDWTIFKEWNGVSLTALKNECGQFPSEVIGNIYENPELLK